MKSSVKTTKRNLSQQFSGEQRDRADKISIGFSGTLFYSSGMSLLTAAQAAWTTSRLGDRSDTLAVKEGPLNIARHLEDEL